MLDYLSSSLDRSPELVRASPQYRRRLTGHVRQSALRASWLVTSHTLQCKRNIVYTAHTPILYNWFVCFDLECPSPQHLRSHRPEVLASHLISDRTECGHTMSYADRGETTHTHNHVCPHTCRQGESQIEEQHRESLTRQSHRSNDMRTDLRIQHNYYTRPHMLNP